MSEKTHTPDILIKRLDFFLLFFYQKKVMIVISSWSQQQTKIFGLVYFVSLCCVFNFLKNLGIFIQHVFFPFFVKNSVGLLLVRANGRKRMKKQNMALGDMV